MSRRGGPVASSVASKRSELETGLTQRLREAVKRVGSGDALSRKAGIPRSTLETYLSGHSEPKAVNVALIAQAAGMSVHYLVTGEGEIDIPVEHAVSEPRQLRYAAAAPGRHVRRELNDRQGLVYLPLYDVHAAAGAAGGVSDGEHVADILAFKEDWIRRELRASPDDLRLIYVAGDSMEPDLRAGDIILIDHTDSTARREGIYVIRMDEALLVKQLQRMPGGLIKVISRNPAYEPFTIAAEKIQGHNGFEIVGRVVWACRRF